MEEEANALLTIILASSIIFELVGPACAKLGLYLSKSYGHDNIDQLAPEAMVKKDVVEDDSSSREIDLLAAQINHLSKEIPPLEVEEAQEAAFIEAAEEYESESYSRYNRRFINRK